MDLLLFGTSTQIPQVGNSSTHIYYYCRQRNDGRECICIFLPLTVYVCPFSLHIGVAIATTFCPLESAAITNSSKWTFGVCDIGISDFMYICTYVYALFFSSLVLAHALQILPCSLTAASMFTVPLHVRHCILALLYIANDILLFSVLLEG